MLRLFRPVLEIVPHCGIGPAHLGASRQDAREAMCRAGFELQRTQGAVDYYCGASLLTECDDTERVSFIEVRPTKRFLARLYGRNVFATPAGELFALAASQDKSGSHTLDHHEYMFPNQLLAFWHADEQYNLGRLRSYPVWGAIGIGNEAYATAVAELQGKA